MKKKSITISDIAAKTGYSKTTVSFAFNWPNRISAEAVAKIMEVAKEMGYKGSGDPYADPEPRYKTLCIFIPETLPQGHAPVWAKPMMRMYELCASQGYMLSLISEKRMSDTFFAKSSAVDAFMAFCPMKIESIFSDTAKRRHIPFIGVNLECDEADADSVRMARTEECARILFSLVDGKTVPEDSDPKAFQFLDVNT